MNKIFIILIVLTMLCSSCATLDNVFKPNESIDNLKENLTTAREQIQTSETGLKKSTVTIKDSAENIQDNSESAKEMIPPRSDPKITETLNDIKISANDIIKETNTLDEISNKLKSIGDNIENAQDNTEKAIGDNEKLMEKIKQLEDEKQQALRKAMNYLIIIAILLIAISSVGVFQGNYKAIGGIVGGVVIIASSLAVSILYAKLAWIGFIGLVGVLFIVGFGVYQGIKNKKDEKALEETVLTVEALKDKLSEDIKKDFFGDKAYPGKTKNLQSKDTEEKILKIRKKNKDKIEHTIQK